MPTKDTICHLIIPSRATLWRLILVHSSDGFTMPGALA